MNLIITRICNFLLPLKHHLKLWHYSTVVSLEGEAGVAPLFYYITDLKSIVTASTKKTNTPVALKIVEKG